MIRRDYYLKKLIDARGNGFLKVITGIRRCGKSYLLSDIYKGYLLEKGVKREKKMPTSCWTRSNASIPS